MNKSSIRLLVTLALAATAVAAGWTHAYSGSRTARADVASLSSAGRPPLAIHSGEPDPGMTPVPKLIAARDTARSLSPMDWASRIWAIWYLKI